MVAARARIEFGKEANSAAPRWRWRPSLSVTLVAGFTILLVVALGGVGFITLYTAQRNTFDLLQRGVVMRIDAIVQSIAVTLNPVKSEVGFLVGLIASGEIDPNDEGRLRAALLGALAATPQVSGVIFVGLDGRIVQATRSDSGFASSASTWRDRRVRDIVTSARESSGPSWGPILFVGNLGDTQLTLFAPVRRESRFLGAVGAVVSIANLSRSVTEAGDGQVSFILAGHDRVIAHPTLVGGPRGVSSTKPLLSLAEVGDPVLAAMWREDRKPIEPLGEVAGHTVAVGDVDYLFLYRQVADYGPEAWTVGAYLRVSDMAEWIDRIRWAGFAALGVLLLSILLALLFARLILRPVQRLARSAEAVGRLDFDAVQPLPGAAFREIDAAMRAHNAMLAGLRLFATYVPRTFVRRLLGRPADAVRPEEREITIVFTDIVGFTGISRRLSPARLSAFLNRHFALLGAAVEAEGGTIDKYIGDSIMAFWGAPEAQPDHAARACRTALAVQARLGLDNQRRERKGLAPVRIRIGIHTGRAIVGNIGAPGRINYTLVGDAVNVAQRIEQLGKEIDEGEADALVLASRSTVEAAGLLDRAVSLGARDLRGRDGSLEVFRLDGSGTAAPP